MSHKPSPFGRIIRGAFKRSTALKRCTRAHSEVCTRTLHHPRAFAESVARSTNSNAAACSLSTPRGAGLSPCTERHSAGHAKQRAAGPRWPEEPLAQLSWASPRTAGAVASTGICDQACQSVARASPSRCCRTFVARQRGASRQAASQRRGSGHHTPVVADACVACDYWQCMVAQIAQAWTRAEAEPAPGSHPRFGRALLLRQHRGAAAAAVKRMNRVLRCFYRDNSTRRARGENDAIADWEQENDPRAQPPGPGP